MSTNCLAYALSKTIKIRQIQIHKEMTLQQLKKIENNLKSLSTSNTKLLHPKFGIFITTNTRFTTAGAKMMILILAYTSNTKC